jgi:hypothetical protein
LAESTTRLIPIVIWSWVALTTTGAVVFTAYMLVVGVIDNVLKPIVMARGVTTPMPIILIGHWRNDYLWDQRAASGTDRLVGGLGLDAGLDTGKTRHRDTGTRPCLLIRAHGRPCVGPPASVESNHPGAPIFNALPEETSPFGLRRRRNCKRLNATGRPFCPLSGGCPLENCQLARTPSGEE